MTVKTANANRWRPLEKYAKFQAAQAAQRAAEQQRRWSAAAQQQEAIDEYAQQLSAKGNTWMAADAGCQAFLLGGVQKFYDTIQAVSQSQRSRLDNLLETRDAALDSLRSADAHRRRIAAIADRHDRTKKQAEQRAERRLEDDLRAVRPASLDVENR